MRLAVTGLCVLASVAPASAAEVRPGGALDITIAGFVRFLAAYGDLDKKPDLTTQEVFRTAPLSTFDFRNDTEVHVIARGVHDPTGIEYGATIEFEADTFLDDQQEGAPVNANTDETWIYVRGGLGELRFGDTDSAATTMKVGGYTAAVGTGGIDGEVVDVTQLVVVEFARDEEDRTKVVYYSPVLGGFQLGLSYTPSTGSAGDDLARTQLDTGEDAQTAGNDRDDVLTAGLSYGGSVGDAALRASVVGAWDPHDPDKTWSVYGGLAVDVADFTVAGGLGRRHQDRPGGGGRRGAAAPPNFDNFERDFFNIGAQYRLDPFAFSVSYGRAWDDQGETALDQGRFSDLVFGAEVGLLAGLTLSAEVARFSFKRLNVAIDERNDNDGWIGLTRLGLAF